LGGGMPVKEGNISSLVINQKTKQNTGKLKKKTRKQE
jgi:hypothetical protein